MEHNERQANIERYGDAIELLKDALTRYPRAMWEYKPTATDWSIHELLVHIADSEANSYIRCRRFIAEPGATVMAYDEAQWARALNYQNQRPEDALELFRWLRGNSYRLIRDLPDSVWANSIYHPENGVMTMDDWLEVYARHIPDHIAQMDRVYRAWQESANPK